MNHIRTNSPFFARAKRAIALMKTRKRRMHQSFIPLAPPPMPMWYDPYMMPPMVPPQLQALLSHQMPYSICLHFNAPCDHHHYPAAESASSTLHSARSSVYEQEKEEVDHSKPSLTRSNSDTLHDRHRPPMTHNKWNTSVNGFYS